MSVLDRMVARLHGEIPAVQPRIASRYAGQESPGGLVEQVVEGDRASAIATPDRGVTVAEVATTVTPSPQHASNTGPASSFLRSDPQGAPAEQSRPSDDESKLLDGSRSAAATQKIETIQNPFSERASAVPSAPFRVPAQAMSPADRDAQSAPRTALPTSLKAGEEEASNAPRAATVAPVEPAIVEQRTEIHITIGGIELRSPAPPARPQPAAKPPRLSLGEFLNGTAGGRR